MRTVRSFGSIHRGSTSDSSVLMSSSSSWGLTLRRRKEPLPVTSFWFVGSSQHHVFHVHPNGACHPRRRNRHLQRAFVILGTSFTSLHLLLFVDVVVQVEHVNVKFHKVDWMGYSAALSQSVRHLWREASKALQSWLQFLFVLQCQLQILIHIPQRWMRMETSEL